MNEGGSLLTTAQLKERGWTPALVKKLLGVPEAMALIRQRVSVEIACIYPEDAQECKRQMRARYVEAQDATD